MPTDSRPGFSRGLLLALVGLAIAAVILITVVVSASGGDDEPSAADLTAAALNIPTGDVAIRQTSFVDIDGAELDRFDSTVADAAIGQPAPGITASHFDNSERTIDFADGTPRLVLFFAHWCPHCQAEVKSLSSVWAANGLPEGIEIIPVSTDVREGSPNYPPSSWFIAEDWPVPVLRDSAEQDFARALGLSGYPYAVSIAGDGTVAARTSGQLSSDTLDAMATAAGA